MRTINNGYRYTLEVKAATIAEVNANPTKRRQAIAVERNMSVATVARWAHAAGASLANNQHPNTAAGVRKYWAKQSQIKAFNTPTVVKAADGTVTIQYRGQKFS